MYREMRRGDRSLSPSETEDLLNETDFGYLATVGPDNQPYVVPVNHAYIDGYIVFHCATMGQKLDNIRHNPKVCYSVCTGHEVLPERHSTRYRSAVAFGTAEIVEDLALKKSLLVQLNSRLAPGLPFPCGDERIPATGLVRIKVEHVTGKSNS